VFENPVKAAEILAEHIVFSQIKDLKPQKATPIDAPDFWLSTPLGEGYVDNASIVQVLKDHNYDGLLAIEIDTLHPDYQLNREDHYVDTSIKYLTQISHLNPGFR